MSPGFEVASAATASVDLFPSGYVGERSHDFQRRAIAAVEALPGVTSAAFTNRIPMVIGGNSSMGIGVEGYVPRENEEIVINYTAGRAALLRDAGHPAARRDASSARSTRRPRPA